MLRVNIYIPEEMDTKLEFVAQDQRKVKAEVVREALALGLRAMQPKSASAQALVDLAKHAEKTPSQGKVPKDFVKNMDFYTWGGDKRD